MSLYFAFLPTPSNGATSGRLGAPGFGSFCRNPATPFFFILFVSVILANAGIQRLCSGLCFVKTLRHWIPAKAGISEGKKKQETQTEKI